MLVLKSLSGYELDGRALSLGEAEQDKVITQPFNVDRTFQEELSVLAILPASAAVFTTLIVWHAYEWSKG